jgi:antitoxin component HigA of HigAB toxin-antitoxin module
LDTISLLGLLIKRWDEEQRPLSDGDPVEFLRSLMKQNNIKASDLAAGVGISKSLLSDILHYHRRLSREVIRKLASRFNVSQALLNKPYNLAPVAKHANSSRQAHEPDPQPVGNQYRKDQPLVRLLEERTGKATVAANFGDKGIDRCRQWTDHLSGGKLVSKAEDDVDFGRVKSSQNANFWSDSASSIQAW